MKLNIKILTNNDCYKTGRTINVKGLMLHSVGCSQPKSSVFLDTWNVPGYKACVHAFVDGNTGEVWQTLPWNHRGWHAGGSANNTHIGVEMCEPSGIKYTGGSTFKIIDKEEALRVVNTTYKSAVELFAYLCSEYNLNPLDDGVIISHAEGHARGLASNHGDPEHLWTQLGTSYTMDGFRKDVAEMLQKRYNTVEEAPEWSRDTLQKLINMGALSGYDGKLDLSLDMIRVLVINDKAGLYRA